MIKLTILSSKFNTNCDFDKTSIEVQDEILTALKDKTSLMIESENQVKIIPYKILKRSIIYINEIKEMTNE